MFTILEHIDRLVPTSVKNKYICPVCSGHNLSINPNNGAYNCFNGCDTKEIRDAIAPLKTPQNNRKKVIKNNKNQQNNTTNSITKQQENINLTLDNIAKVDDNFDSSQYLKTERKTRKDGGYDEISYYYYSGLNRKVVYRHYDANGNRMSVSWRNEKKPQSKHSYWQHKEGETWVKGKDSSVPSFAYGIDAIKAKNLTNEGFFKGKYIFAFEGEQQINTAWLLGYYAIDLTGLNEVTINLLTSLGIKGLIVFGDNDSTGHNYVNNCQKLCDKVNLSCIVKDYRELNSDITEKTDITDLFKTMDKKQLVAHLSACLAVTTKIEKQINSILHPCNILAPNEGDDPKPRKFSKTELYQFCLQRFSDRLRLNKLGQVVELDGKQYAVEEAHLDLNEQYWIENTTKELCADIFVKIAKKNQYDPVKEYLDNCVQKETELLDIDNLATRYLGTTNPLYNIFLKKTLISAVARIYNEDPKGCKVDTCLILKGEQGKGKSTFFDVLAGEFFDDSMGDGKDKDDRLILHSCWFQEWGEIDNVFSQREASALKAFLSKKKDKLRVPYGRTTETFLRRSIIVGSTNNDTFLKDPTGSRRFWIIPTENNKINIELLTSERDQLWASIVKAYKDGQIWWLTDEEQRLSNENNRDFQNVDVWVETLQNYNLHQYTTKKILEDIMGIEVKHQSSFSNRLSNCMKLLGYEKKRVSINNKRDYYWLDPNQYDQVAKKVSQDTETLATQSLDTPAQPLENSQNEVKPTKPSDIQGFDESLTNLVEKNDSEVSQSETLIQQVCDQPNLLDQPNLVENVVNHQTTPTTPTIKSLIEFVIIDDNNQFKIEKGIVLEYDVNKGYLVECCDSDINSLSNHRYWATMDSIISV